VVVLQKAVRFGQACYTAFARPWCKSGRLSEEYLESISPIMNTNPIIRSDSALIPFPSFSSGNLL
jgi:hypothetical protein